MLVVPGLWRGPFYRLLPSAVFVFVPLLAFGTTLRFTIFGGTRWRWYMAGPIIAALLLAVAYPILDLPVESSSGADPDLVRRLVSYSPVVRLGLCVAAAVTGVLVSALGVYPGLILHLLREVRRDELAREKD
jgi:hypothetical protein